MNGPPSVFFLFFFEGGVLDRIGGRRIKIDTSQFTSTDPQGWMKHPIRPVWKTDRWSWADPLCERGLIEWHIICSITGYIYRNWNFLMKYIQNIKKGWICKHSPACRHILYILIFACLNVETKCILKNAPRIENDWPVCIYYLVCCRGYFSGERNHIMHRMAKIFSTDNSITGDLLQIC